MSDEQAVWKVRHGDTSYSDVWAVLDENGSTLNLTGWAVLAQARESADAEHVLHEFTRTRGVLVDTAEVRLPSGRKVSTSTIQLVLHPGDFEWIPRQWSGVFDVEITQSDTDGKPTKRFTVVPDGTLVVTPDVTRSAT